MGALSLVGWTFYDQPTQRTKLEVPISTRYADVYFCPLPFEPKILGLALLERLSL